MSEKSLKGKILNLFKDDEPKEKADAYLFNLILLLLAGGLVMCFSASAPSAQSAYGDSYYYLKSQALWVVIGLVCMLIVMNFPYKKWKSYTGIIMIFTIVLLIITLFMPEINGARRWIDIGITTFQPSEIAKFAVILWFAKKLEKQKWQKAKYFKGFFHPYLTMLLLIGALLMGEPHFSCTMLITLVVFAMLFVSGAKLWHIIVTVLPLIPAIGALAYFSPYRFQRIMAFIDPFSDPTDSTWQIVQSLYAVGSGGLFGLGLGQSRQKYLYLPEPQNDFIFAIVCEELGFIGALLIIILFAALVWRGIVIAINAKDKYGCLLATGITALIAVQILVNIAVVTSSMPVTGMPLPFFSSGGTSMVFMLMQMGVLLNISRYR